MDGQIQEAFDDDDLETQRATVRRSFDEIVADIGIAMHDARLTFPIGLTIPSSGHTIITLVTPFDPSDNDWEQASAIVRNVLSKKLGGIRLRSRNLPCATVNAKIAAAEITPNALEFDTRL